MGPAAPGAGPPLSSLCASVSLHHQLPPPPQPTHEPMVPTSGTFRDTGTGRALTPPFPRTPSPQMGPCSPSDVSHEGAALGSSLGPLCPRRQQGWGQGRARLPLPPLSSPRLPFPGGGSAAHYRIHLSQKYCSVEPAPSGSAAPASPRHRAPGDAGAGSSAQALDGSVPPKGDRDHAGEGDGSGAPRTMPWGRGAASPRQPNAVPHTGPTLGMQQPAGPRQTHGTRGPREPSRAQLAPSRVLVLPSTRLPPPAPPVPTHFCPPPCPSGCHMSPGTHLWAGSPSPSIAFLPEGGEGAMRRNFGGEKSSPARPRSRGHPHLTSSCCPRWPQGLDSAHTAPRL